jgi:histone H3/H4
MNESKTEQSEKDFSKNAIIKISRKAGIKCISECGIKTIRNILNKKIKTFAEGLSDFFSSKNGKTIDKKAVLLYLRTQNIKYVM